MNPEAAELCNGVDDNCDGTVDEGCGTDADGDGHTEDVDCDDNDPDVFPGQTRFFHKARADGSFDYNCDKRDQLKYPNETRCHLDCRAPGWIPKGSILPTAGGDAYGVPPCATQGTNPDYS